MIIGAWQELTADQLAAAQQYAHREVRGHLGHGRAAAAIIGGLVGAVWQTRRADDVARSIRRAERREKGLLSLNATVASIQTELDRLYRQSERGQTPFQYQEALRLVGELTLHWETASSGVIPDADVINAYARVRAAAHDGLPSGRISFARCPICRRQTLQ